MIFFFSPPCAPSRFLTACVCVSCHEAPPNPPVAFLLIRFASRPVSPSFDDPSLSGLSFCFVTTQLLLLAPDFVPMSAFSMWLFCFAPGIFQLFFSPPWTVAVLFPLPVMSSQPVDTSGLVFFCLTWLVEMTCRPRVFLPRGREFRTVFPMRAPQELILSLRPGLDLASLSVLVH